MDTYNVELNENDYDILFSIAKSFGLNVKDFLIACSLWLKDPQHCKRATDYLRHAMKDEILEVKKQKYERLLLKGWDPEYAAYFADGIKRAVSVDPSDNYTLLLTFDNGELRRLDCKPYMNGTGSFLWDIENFRRVRLEAIGVVTWDIDPNVDSSVVWENVFDLCPDEVYICSTPVAADPVTMAAITERAQVKETEIRKAYSDVKTILGECPNSPFEDMLH